MLQGDLLSINFATMAEGDQGKLVLVRIEFVDDSVVAVEQFPQSGILELRDISACSREVLKHFHGSDDASGEIAGVGLGVTGDERADRVEIVRGLRGPDQASHLASRSFTSP